MKSTHDDQPTPRAFSGVDRLYGQGAHAALDRAAVLVVGVGGVGSWATEALARCGVGRIAIADLDHVAESNINRQIQALVPTLGMAKTEAMVQRADLRALAAQVRYVVDPANPYPKQFTGHLRVTLKDGRVMEARQGYFKGGADHPLSDADLQTKFFANCLHGGLAKPRADAMLAMIQQIFDAPQVDLSLRGA